MRAVTTRERNVARSPSNEAIGLLKRATKYVRYAPRLDPAISERPVRLAFGTATDAAPLPNVYR